MNRGMLRRIILGVAACCAAASQTGDAVAAVAVGQCAHPAWRPEACFNSHPSYWCYLLVPELTGSMWALFLFTHLFLSFAIRSLCITPNDYLYPKLFKENVSGWQKLPLWMHEKYLIPWQATPIELMGYPLFTRAFFWITRVAGILAITFLFLTLLTYLLDRLSGCLSP
jgi:hypothetical protein